MSGRRHKASRRADRLAAQTAYVKRFMVSYIATLRSILKRAWPEYSRRHPDTRGPCHSCAFNPSTDTWTGFEKTVFSLTNAIRKRQPFYCHEHLPTDPTGQWYCDPTMEMPPRCRGWDAIADHPETAAAARATVKTLGPPPP